MTTNREKNQAYDQRQQKAKRPAPGNYDFSALTAAVNSWFENAVVTADEEIYSPYLGA